MATVNPGEPLPDLGLHGLSDSLGRRPVVLYFFPRSATPG
jgi:peroxiredoxin